MIQRIQSITLIAIAIICLLCIFAIPYSMKKIEITIFLSTVAVISTATIFLYKKRILQLRLVKICTIVLFITEVVIFLYIYEEINKMQAIKGNIFLIIAVLIAWVLTLFTAYKIKKDEELVKSLDRIR